jgi:hypothetical protein
VAILARVDRATLRSTPRDIDRELIARMRDHVISYAATSTVGRVAVVANAPLAPSAERRDLIDSADVVIRCNSLALDRPQGPPCVGTRTHVVVTARTARPTPGFLADYRNRAYFVVDVFQLTVPEPRGWPASWPADLGAWPLSNRALGLPLKYLLRPSDAGQGLAPTTGTQAAYLAHRLFPDADIVLAGYSFLDDPDQRSWGYHQPGMGPSPVHSTHKLDREGAYLQGLVDRGEVRCVA